MDTEKDFTLFGFSGDNGHHILILGIFLDIQAQVSFPTLFIGAMAGKALIR